jgi:hypothetical protein
MKSINIEGYEASEILKFPADQLDGFLLSGEPIVFRAGSAEVLGEFRLKDEALQVELAHIDGGGEGVLAVLVSLTRRYAQNRGVHRIEWIVHSLNCAAPNMKLRRVMEQRGFVVTNVEGIGESFYMVDEV